MASEEIVWLEVADFSAGIVSNTLRAPGRFAPSHNPGAASAHNTYRCLSLPTGGLGPGPRRQWRYDATSEIIPAGDLQPGRKYNISGFYVAGPMGTDGPQTTRNREIFFGLEWLGYDGTDEARHWRLDKLLPTAQGDPYQTNLHSWSTTQRFPTADSYAPMKGITTLSRPSSGASDRGVPVVILAHSDIGPGNPARILAFPNVDQLSTSAVEVLNQDQYWVGQLIGHQGRVVWTHRTTIPHGAGNVGSMWLSDEYVHFTATNDVRNTIVPFGTPHMWSQENPAGYGTSASLSANELLLIKSEGGAVMIRGDLAGETGGPLVTRLPNVPPAMVAVGATTRLGFAYAGADGEAYLWQGSDTAEPISQQMAPEFWHVASKRWGGPHVWWTAWRRFLVASNLYFMDTQTMGWWRLDDPDELPPMWNMQAGGSRWLFGAPVEFEQVGDPMVFGWLDTSPATSWSWQGHPYRPFEGDREIDIRQILVRGQGSGTIKITPIRLDGTYADPTTVTFTAPNAPVTKRVNVSVEQQFIHYRIEAEGSGGNTAAPVLHSISFGVQARNQIPVETGGA